MTWRDKIIGIASLAFIQMELHWQERLLNDKKAIEKYHEDEMPYVIKEDMARVIEVDIIREYARDYYRSHGTKSELRVCITGALELYLKLQGLSVYKDLALDLAEPLGKLLKGAGGGHSTSAGVNGYGSLERAMELCESILKELLTTRK